MESVEKKTKYRRQIENCFNKLIKEVSLIYKDKNQINEKKTEKMVCLNLEDIHCLKRRLIFPNRTIQLWLCLNQL